MLWNLVSVCIEKSFLYTEIKRSKNQNGQNHLLRTQTSRPLPCPVRVRRLPRHSRSMHFGDLSEKLKNSLGPTILVKTFGTLNHLQMICTFSNNPSPPPRTVLGVTGQKLWKSLLKCMNFNFVRGWGGGGNRRQSCWKLNFFPNHCTSVLNPVFSCFPCTTISYADLPTFLKNLPNKLA